jgi:hypothetical protein
MQGEVIGWMKTDNTSLQKKNIFSAVKTKVGGFY